MNNDQTVFQGPNILDNSKTEDINTAVPPAAVPLVPSPDVPLSVPEPVTQMPVQDVVALGESSIGQQPPRSESVIKDLISQEMPTTQEVPVSQGFQDAQQSLESSPTPTPPPAEVVQPVSGDDYSGGNRFSVFKKIAKVLIGLFVVMLVFMFIVGVVIPILTKNSSAKTTLTYWGLWEDSNTMQGVISDFERQNPNIVINYSKQDIKQYRERLVTRIGNGNGPDIFRFHNSWYPMLSGALLALPSDTISKDEFNKSFYPVAQKDLIRNGAIYGIPLEIDTLSLFVNNKLFQSAGIEPPMNWNDFINDARALTVKDVNGKIKTAGAAIGTFSNISHAPDIISLLFMQNGVDLKNLQNSPDRAAGALTFYTSFVTDSNNVWDNTLDPSLLVFSRGDLGMYFGYSWDYFAIKQANPNLDFKIVPVPQLPDENITLASYWAEGVSAKSKHPKEALLFMKYLSAKSTEEKLYADQAKIRGLGEPYARVDLADTLKSNTVLSTAISQAPNATSSFFIDNTFDGGLNDQANAYLGNAINSIVNGSSPQSALDTLSQGTAQLLQKYGQ